MRRKFLLLLLLLPFILYSSKRGIISIKAKTHSGKILPLYSGYYALVIGVSNYKYLTPLPNAVKDAETVASALRRLGFKVKLVKNPTKEKLLKALTELATGPGADPNRAILIYFAGHGYTLQQVDGTPLGYILPTDTPSPAKEAEFRLTAISMRQLQDIILTMRAKHVLAVFDSCFSGALWNIVRDPTPAYITEAVSEPVREFITAGRENEQVPDRSVFKEVFLQAITKGYADADRDGYITGLELGAYLSKNVVNYTRGGQHPQFGKINNPRLDKGDFVFVLRSQPSAPSPQPSAPPPPPSTTFNLEDLKQKAKIRAQWNSWQSRMKQAFEEVKALEKDSSLNPEEKKKAWERFISAYSKDNPYSSEDDIMREYANSRINYWTEYIQRQASVLASINTGIIMGKVMDAEYDEPLPGVSIKLSGRKTAEAVTNAEGEFSIDSLPPGTYTLQAQLQGFKTVVIKNIVIHSDKVVPLGIRMEMGELKEEVEYTRPVSYFYNNIQMVYIPEGEFLMGSPEGKGAADEHPQHRVYLDDYWISEPVTVKQYKKFCKETGRKPPSGKDNSPVAVTWKEAKAYAKWLSKKTGFQFRLPTEAEWERACRLGLLDVDGLEWVEDWYSSNFYSLSPKKNPLNKSYSWGSTSKVVRGGYFEDPEKLKGFHFNCASRNGVTYNAYFYFRVVLKTKRR